MKGAESYLNGAMDALEKVRQNLPQIKAAAKLRQDDTDGECDLRVMKKLTREEVTE